MKALRLILVLVVVASYSMFLFFFFVHESFMWKLGKQVPYTIADFTLEEVRGGRSFDLNDAHGRPLVILVFSTLSPDLGQYLEAAADAVEKHQDKGAMFGAVNFQDIDRDQLLEQLARGDYPFPVYDGFSEAFELEGHLKKVPMLFVLDRRQRLLVALATPDAATLNAALAHAANDGSRESKLPRSMVDLPSPPEDGPMAWTRIGSQAQALLSAGKLDELEAMAGELRAAKTRFPDGVPMLAGLYDGLAGESWRRVDEDGLSPYPARIADLEAWAAAKPQSITPRVALVKAYLYWAWRARGAGEVQVEPKEFQQRLQKAFDLAQAAKALAEKDPELWRAQLGAALALQKEAPEYDALIAEGLAVDPGYERLLEAKIPFLSQRWMGEAGDREAYAEKTAAERGDPALLARLVDGETDFYGPELFKVTKLTWPKLRDSLRQLEAKHPNSLYRLNRFTRYACIAEDKEEARRLMDKVGLRYREDAWNARGRFDACLDWAIGRKPKPEDVPDLRAEELRQRLARMRKFAGR